LNNYLEISNKNLNLIILFILLIEFIFAAFSLLGNAEIVASLVCILLILILGLLREEFIPFLLNIFILTTLYITFPEKGFYRYELSNKNIYPFEILLIIFLLWFLIKEIYTGFSFLKKLTKIDLLIILWIIGLLIAAFRGISFGRSVSDLIFETRFLFFVCVYIIFSFFLSKETLRKGFLSSLVIIGVFLVLVNILNLFSIGEQIRVGGQTRITGGEQSAIFSTIAFFSLAFALYHPKKFYLLITVFFICGLFILISYQRASYVQFLASFLFMGLFIEWKKKKFFVISIIVILSFLIIVFVGASVFNINLENYSAAFSERATSLELQTKDNSILGRYIEYYLAYTNIKENPVFGSGMGLVLKFLSPTDFGPLPTERIVLHNELLWMALKSGIPNALLFIFLVVFVILVSKKNYKETTDVNHKAFLLGAISSLIGIVILAQFEDAFHKHRVGYMFWAVLGIIGAYYRSYRHQRSINISTNDI